MRISITAIGLGWTLVTYVLYLFLQSFLTSRRNAKKARELKCEAPIIQKNRWPLGLDQLKRALAADKAQLFPVDSYKRTIENNAITYQYSILGVKQLFTADEKNVQAILATQFADFDLGPHRRGNFSPLLGNGIFTEDGKPWEHSRAMMRPQFAREQVSDLQLEELHVQNMMRALDFSKQSNNWTDTIDLQVFFFRLTLDSATEFLFGQSVDSQIAHAPGYKKTEGSVADANSLDFATAFDKGQMGLATRARFMDFYWLYSSKEFRDSCKICAKFIDHYVALALSKDLHGKGLEKGTKEKYIFLDALAALTKDPIELRSQLLNILLAGRDTTASLLGWLFLELSKDPAQYNKLRNVIIEEFGTYEQPSEITFSKLKGCQYLQHCINEALRLYPVVPVNGRYANKDTTLPRGGGKDGKSKLFVPKGSSVDYSVFVMQRRRDIWGEDADDFKPERWVNRKVGWEYLPFNGGPRICIGQQFALTEASFVTVRLLQRYDKIENMETDHIVRHNLTLTDCSGNGVKVRMHIA